MEWNDVVKIMEREMPSRKDANITGTTPSNHTVHSLRCLQDNFRNTSEMEAVLRVAIIVMDAVAGTDIKIQLQPSVSHSTFTDHYFIITRDGEEVPLAFIAVKNTSIAVDFGSQLKPVAQALREAHIVCETLSNRQDIQVPFILTNSTFWSFGLAKRAGGGKIFIEDRFHLVIDLSKTDSTELQKLISATKKVIQGNWPLYE